MTEKLIGIKNCFTQKVLAKKYKTAQFNYLKEIWTIEHLFTFLQFLLLDLYTIVVDLKVLS